MEPPITDKDPWLWTSEDLIRQICKSTQLFQAIGHAPLHDLDLQGLAENILLKQTTGREFLTNIDVEVLRTAFRIDHIAKQNALFAIIELLRSQSLLYKQYVATARVQSMDLNIDHDPRTRGVGINSKESAIVDPNGRKRRKIATITTETMPSTSGELYDSNRFTDSGSTQAVGEDWSHLLHWELDGDGEVVELDGLGDDIDDEESLAEVVEQDEAEVLREGGAEVEVAEEEELDSVRSGKRRVGKVDKEAVVNIINERIEFFAAQWRPGKGEDQAHQPPDPVTLWEEAETAGRRQQLVEANKAEIDYLGKRLNYLGDELLGCPYNTTEEVQHVCKNLETTVDLLEEAKWLLSIYELSPVDDSDDQEASTQGPVIEEVTRGLHRSPVEIIDLGSASGSSDSQPEDHDGLHPNAEERTGAMTHTSGAANRINTPESMVAVSTEPDAVRLERQSRGRDIQSPGTALYGRQPELASIHGVSHWDMSELVAKADRKRIIMKIIYEMSAENRELIRTRVGSVRKKDLLGEIPACVHMWLKKETKMPGILQKDTYKIVAFAKLFLCWWRAGNYFNNENPTEWHLEELAESLDAGCPDPQIFYDWLRHILANTFSKEALKTPGIPSQAEYIIISDDED
ncbi:hypothetical protein K458DRAFT_421354 [Lentithecium fluviatile CBS 122367]|uniref:DUF7607 domain-containing protein n=1 Tax=Lentithecium fluviatile CBS 122367 TaxID=1168545 RepID=A0A6G1IR00_9PLEO|nr:hypothetical protein K458DRAFT_421354 [Lentithecium fluviatile CBS 122367]